MAKELPVSLVGSARDRYLRRLETRMEFLHDFVSGNEDGWGLEGKDLENVVEHLTRAWAIVKTSEIRMIHDRRPQGPHAVEAAPQGGNIIPFRPRLS